MRNLFYIFFGEGALRGRRRATREKGRRGGGVGAGEGVPRGKACRAGRRAAREEGAPQGRSRPNARKGERRTGSPSLPTVFDHPAQNVMRTDIWNSRGKFVWLVMLPKVLGLVTASDGAANSGVFVRFSASARNCT